MSLNLALRSISDFTSYLLRLRRELVAVFAADAVFTGVALLTLRAAANTAADSPARVLFVFSVLRLGWNLWKLARSLGQLLRGSALRISLHGRLDLSERRMPVMDLQPSEIEELNGFRCLHTRTDEVVLYSPDVDLRFQDGACAIRLQRSRMKEDRLKRHVSGNRERLSAVLISRFLDSFSRQAFFNESKLGLASDLLTDNGDLKYARVGYFDSFLTNEASSFVMDDASGDRRIDCTDMFPFEVDSNGTARLKSLGTSDCANHIGISTVGFTKDKHMILWEQSPRTQQSQGLLAPTGSGSADFADLDDDLLRTLERAMRRELHRRAFGTIAIFRLRSWQDNRARLLSVATSGRKARVRGTERTRDRRWRSRAEPN